MPAILVVIGASNTGKTTLVTKIISYLKGKGFSVATIKHDPHDHFEIDRPGRDTWKHSQAGADAVCLASPNNLAVIYKLKEEKQIDELVKLFFPQMDIVIVEGYKHSEKPALELVNIKENESLNYDTLISKNRLALIGNHNIDGAENFFHRDNIDSICELILNKFFPKGDC